jgi:uncharacterized membrane protein
MEGIYYTLHDFMLHSKNVIYIIIVLALVAIGPFWRFLNKGNEEK